MLFAWLFIAAFIAGLLIYSLNRKWVAAVSVPTVLFASVTLIKSDLDYSLAFMLTFGLPIVFFASLLGAYVVQMRTTDPAPEDSQQSE